MIWGIQDDTCVDFNEDRCPGILGKSLPDTERLKSVATMQQDFVLQTRTRESTYSRWRWKHQRWEALGKQSKERRKIQFGNRTTENLSNPHCQVQCESNPTASYFHRCYRQIARRVPRRYLGLLIPHSLPSGHPVPHAASPSNSRSDSQWGHPQSRQGLYAITMK